MYYYENNFWHLPVVSSYCQAMRDVREFVYVGIFNISSGDCAYFFKPCKNHEFPETRE